mgnify:CR=1 FL=1
MFISKNNIIKGKHNKPILLDFGYKITKTQKPIIVFAHGFKGFKDWGHFNKVMEYFIENDFAFVKFNFSHNGGTIKQPIDLEAFGNNNYTKELADLKTVIDWVENNNELSDKEIDKQKIYLIGHSRGGGISILAAHEDKRIKKLITWAAVADLINRYTQQQMEVWKKEGVIYVANARTKQQMPLYYQLAEDTLKNASRFNIESASKKIVIPHLIIHGSADEAVNISEAKKIHQWNKSSSLEIITGAGHTFGAVHPYTAPNFPKDVQLVLAKTLAFIKQ